MRKIEEIFYISLHIKDSLGEGALTLFNVSCVTHVASLRVRYT